MKKAIVGGIIASFPAGILGAYIIEIIPESYLFVLFYLGFGYCLYSLIVFSWMLKDKEFSNKYSRIYRRYVRLFLSAVILYTLCWLLWSNKERVEEVVGIISNYVEPYIPDVSEPLGYTILVAIIILPLIPGFIASICLLLYIFEGGLLTWFLPFVILRKHNRNEAIAYFERNWRSYLEFWLQHRKFKIFCIIMGIFWSSFPLLLIIAGFLIVYRTIL